MVLEIGAVRGGYGWIFPKGDHVNVGVGGDESEGPRLRAELRHLCREYGIDPEAAADLRGYRLPLRRPESRLARGTAAVIGDAAGLVDPFSGDGMYEAFLSSQLVDRGGARRARRPGRRARAVRAGRRPPDHPAHGRRLGREGRLRPLPAHDLRARAPARHLPRARAAARRRGRPSRRRPRAGERAPSGSSTRSPAGPATRAGNTGPPWSKAPGSYSRSPIRAAWISTVCSGAPSNSAPVTST